MTALLLSWPAADVLRGLDALQTAQTAPASGIIVGSSSLLPAAEQH
jgi:hypothetical protein